MTQAKVSRYVVAMDRRVNDTYVCTYVLRTAEKEKETGRSVCSSFVLPRLTATYVCTPYSYEVRQQKIASIPERSEDDVRDKVLSTYRAVAGYYKNHKSTHVPAALVYVRSMLADFCGRTSYRTRVR